MCLIVQFEVFHNGSNYEYHFILKELANEFEGQFEFLGENKEKYKTFSVPVKKEITKIDKDGNENYQILLIILQKKFIKSNVKIGIFLLNIQVSRTIW